MNKHQLVEALRAHPFETDIALEFGVMDELTAPHPYSDDLTASIVARSRKFLYQSLDSLEPRVLADVICEIQMDLDHIRTERQEIKRYGVWYYQMPGEGSLPKDMIRYAKAVGV